MSAIAILGRQPAIGLAELEALFSADKIIPLNAQTALLDIPCQDIAFDRLGGTVKLAELIGKTSAANLKFYLKTFVAKLDLPTAGKINLGLSGYGLKAGAREVNALALELKKHLKLVGYSVRVIPNRETALNAAQVLHNRLLGNQGLELILVYDGSEVLVGRSKNVQDIESYTLRDRLRPKRDAKVGMLPPKLAQIIINLAGSGLKPTGNLVLDPFCGTGVLLQEALLMGFDVLGTDIDTRMVEFSTANLSWLREQYPGLSNKNTVKAGDAQTATWDGAVKTVASETMLGPALFNPLPPDRLIGVINELNLLHKKFLQNIARQIAPKTRLCLALPAWKVKDGFKHLPLLDHLGELGYNRLAFKYAEPSQLIYHRPEQFVARELAVLIRE